MKRIALMSCYNNSDNALAHYSKNDCRSGTPYFLTFLLQARFCNRKQNYDSQDELPYFFDSRFVDWSVDGSDNYKGSDQSSDQGSDQDSDQGADQDSDQGADQSSDQDSDQSSDKGTDQGSNEGSDQGSDKETDQGSNGGSDRGSNGGSDRGSDQGTHTRTKYTETDLFHVGTNCLQFSFHSKRC
jgi:hypothetical protein